MNLYNPSLWLKYSFRGHMKGFPLEAFPAFQNYIEIAPNAREKNPFPDNQIITPQPTKILKGRARVTSMALHKN